MMRLAHSDMKDDSDCVKQMYRKVCVTNNQLLGSMETFLLVCVQIVVLCFHYMIDN